MHCDSDVGFICSQQEGVACVIYAVHLINKLNVDLQIKTSNPTETSQASHLTCGVFVNERVNYPRLRGFVLHTIDSIRTCCSVPICVGSQCVCDAELNSWS